MKLLKYGVFLLALMNVYAVCAESEITENDNKSDIAKEHNKQIINANLSNVSQVDFHGDGSISKIKGDFYLQLDKDITKGKSSIKLENTLRDLNILPFNQELSLENKFSDINGNKAYRFNRMHHGLVVEGADIIVELDKFSRGVKAIVNTRPIGVLPSNIPLYSKERIQGILYPSRDINKIELKYYTQADFTTTLAWFVELNSASPECNNAEQPLIILDANNGKVIKQLSNHYDSLSRNINRYEYIGVDPCNLEISYQLNGQFNENSPPAVTDTYALQLWQNFEFVYNYYKYNTPFNIDSFDGLGGTLKIKLYLSELNNAGWSAGTREFVFYKKTASAIDVAGHEFTHAFITESEQVANLEYLDESGALNESFADIVGVLVENDGLSGSPSQEDINNIWLIGEETGRIFRDFSNPKNSATMELDDGVYFKPAEHYDEYANFNPQYDNGGVHVFSSISNLAFYLLANGGSHPNPDLSDYMVTNGIGLNNAFDIFYSAYQNLNSNASFSELRKQTVLAAAAKGKTKEVCTIWEIVGVPKMVGDSTCDGINYDTIEKMLVTNITFEYGSCNTSGRYGLLSWNTSTEANSNVVEHLNGSTWYKIYDGSRNMLGRTWTAYGNQNIRIKAYQGSESSDWAYKTIYVPSCQGGGGVPL